MREPKRRWNIAAHVAAPFEKSLRSVETRMRWKSGMASSSRRDRDFHHAVAALAKQPIRFGDVGEFEAMGDERAKVEATAANHVQEAAHAFLTAGAKRCDDAVV